MKSLTALRNYAAILSDDVVSVLCTFKPTSDFEKPKTYTYLCTRPLAQTLRRGDLVMVPNTNTSTFPPVNVVYVEKVHREVLLDEPDTREYVWILNKVDPTAMLHMTNWQHETAARMADSQRRRAQKAMMTELGFDGEDTNLLLAPVAGPIEDGEVLEDGGLYTQEFGRAVRPDTGSTVGDEADGFDQPGPRETGPVFDQPGPYVNKGQI